MVQSELEKINKTPDLVASQGSGVIEPSQKQIKERKQ